MKILWWSVVIFLATSVVAQESRVTVNADTLIKIHYCLGVYKEWIERLQDDTDPILVPEVRKMVTKRARLTQYALAFVLDVPTSITILTLSAQKAGTEDVVACKRGIDEQQCVRLRDSKYVECIRSVPACSKSQSCTSFDVPF
ncbi:MAG: hypothetical protein CR217_05450 [Beijerinckiaceae bacterium]|nr:MAG: hypothetical protein CR217_05450 [Beijerinckiaceae bacterium]